MCTKEPFSQELAREQRVTQVPRTNDWTRYSHSFGGAEILVCVLGFTKQIQYISVSCLQFFIHFLDEETAENQLIEYPPYHSVHNIYYYFPLCFGSAGFKLPLERECMEKKCGKRWVNAARVGF